MTLPSELLGLIEALIEAAGMRNLNQHRGAGSWIEVQLADSLKAEDAALTALIAGIQRYREEGQDAVRQPNFAEMRDHFLEQETILPDGDFQRQIYVTPGSDAAHVLNAFVGFLMRRFEDYALRPTPPEEPKP